MERLFIYSLETGAIEQIVAPAPPEASWPRYTKRGLGVLVSDRDDVNPRAEIVRDGALVPIPDAEKDAQAEVGAWRDLRARRAVILRRRVDTINPMRWEEMGEPLRKLWREYRQALLDLPANTTDPRNPKWPEAPE